ncbi:MAG: hypothetical protein HC906_04610 [Bacteroidales bacterium]|nr:hypothetical protein [Bacteroidales bacterium]
MSREGVPISDVALQWGVNPLFTMIPVMLILYAGTFFTTLIWCVFYLGLKNKSLKDYHHAGSSSTLLFNYMYGLLAGLLWFGQFFILRNGKKQTGSIYIYSMGNINGSYHRFCNGLGPFPRGVERGFRKNYCTHDFCSGNDLFRFIHDWY